MRRHRLDPVLVALRVDRGTSCLEVRDTGQGLLGETYSPSLSSGAPPSPPFAVASASAAASWVICR